VHPIGAVLPICSGLTEEQFASTYPYPVLLMHGMQQSLSQVDDPKGSTIDRILLAPDAPTPSPADVLATTRANQAAPNEMYFVFPLSPRTAPGSTLIVGCSPECDVRIDDRSISKIHAVLKTDSGRTFIKDNDSTSGTQVNGDLLEPKKWVEIETGDCISLGFVDTVFLLPVDLYRFVRRLFID